MQTINNKTPKNGNLNDKLAVPFQIPSIGKEEEEAVLRVMRSGWLTTGKETLAFEKEFAEFISRPCNGESEEHKKLPPITALAVNSNTSGMMLAMDACGVKKGTAIITTPYTFTSTSMCAQHLGADVYFADIEKDSYSIDPVKVEEILKKDTEKKIKAIVPVHIAGNVCNMDEILRIAHKYGVYVIEDSAHALPSPTHNGYAGAIGDIGVYSFYATKTLSTAEGGMVVTRNPEFLKRMMTLRMHGMDRTTWDRYTSPRASWEYDIIESGYKYNLPDILSAIGREQLKKQDLFTEKRKHIVELYNNAFKDLDYIILPPDGEGNCWYMYLMRIDESKLNISRTEFAKAMQAAGIGISVHFIPHFHFTYWKKRKSDFTAENYPNSEKQYQSTITIPLWPDMTDDMAKKVIETVKSIGEANHKK